MPCQRSQNQCVERTEKPRSVQKRVGKEDDDRNRRKEHQAKWSGTVEKQRAGRCDIGKCKQGEHEPCFSEGGLECRRRIAHFGMRWRNDARKGQCEIDANEQIVRGKQISKDAPGN